MKSALFAFDEDKKVKYISSKQLGRLLSSKEFKNFFTKYKGFEFEDIDYHLSRSVTFSQPVYDKVLQAYVLRTKMDIFDYTMIIDNPCREYIHFIKNRKFYLELYHRKKSQ